MDKLRNTLRNNGLAGMAGLFVVNAAVLLSSALWAEDNIGGGLLTAGAMVGCSIIYLVWLGKW